MSWLKNACVSSFTACSTSFITIPLTGIVCSFPSRSTEACAVPAEGTSVQLVHKVSGLALTVPGEAENGTALVLAEAQGSASQLWKLTTTVKGCRRITHVASGKVIDIKDISDADGAPAQLWEFVKGDNQNWVLTEVEKEKKTPAKCAAKTAKPAAKEKAKAEVKAEAKPVAKTTKAAAKTTKTAKKTK